VLLDTNVLFLPGRNGFPLAPEIERLCPGARMVVATATLRELDRLARRGVRGTEVARALAARLAAVPASAEGDDGIVEVAVRDHSIVVTADRALQVRLRRLGVAVIAPRDRHRLVLRPGHPGRRRREGPDSARAATVKK
jgi:rRNA-processing protein FCF1